MLLLLALAALGFYFTRGEAGDTAEIYRDDVLLKTIDLKTAASGTFTLPEVEGMVFVVNEGAIGIKSSNCPDKLCVKSGLIARTGAMCVCLPNRIVIKLVGESDLDIII